MAFVLCPPEVVEAAFTAVTKCVCESVRLELSMLVCRSMVALLVSTPEVAGAAFTSELYSAHLDVHQRMLILETLASAAQQMANPRARLQAGADLMPGLRGSLESGSEAVTNATQGWFICI